MGAGPYHGETVGRRKWCAVVGPGRKARTSSFGKELGTWAVGQLHTVIHTLFSVRVRAPVFCRLPT